MALPTDHDKRKEHPIFRGVLAYFPDAIAEIAHVSFIGNKQHNDPLEPMHWARKKSADHEDCIVRHLIEHGSRDSDGMRHTAKMAWRALALLQLELEEAEENAAYEELVALRAAVRSGHTPSETEERLLRHGIPPSARAGNWLYESLMEAGESARKLNEERETGVSPPVNELEEKWVVPYDPTFQEGGITIHEPKPEVRGKGWNVNPGPVPDFPRPKLIAGDLHPQPHKLPTFYIAGPMRGYENYNFPAFYAAEKRGQELGYNTINPARMDEESGFKETDEVTSDLTKEFVKRDIGALLSLDPAKGDGIALLEGWEYSVGATAEAAVAKWLGLKIVTAIDFKGETV